MAELNTCKSFNPWYLLAMAIGAMIGPWVVMMQWWVQLSGPSIGLAFTLVGIMCVPIALVYGEMTAMLPFTGGPFVYVNSAFGKHAAFWSTWGLLLAYLSVLGFLIMAAIQLVQYLWWPDMTQFQLVVIGIIVAILIYLLASRSIIVSATAQFVMTVLMLLVAVVVILMFTTHETFTTANWSPFFATGTDGFFTGAALMITMYFGFELVPQFVQECNYPARSFWKIILGSLAFTIVFYSILPLVDSGMLPWSELQNTEMVDATIGGQLFGRWFQYMVAGVALLTIITTLTGFWLASARILFSMGQARILPAWFDKLNKNETPGNASVVILAICIFFMVASGTNWLAALLALMATGLGIAYTGSSLAFLQLRRKYPQWVRPWKLPVGNLIGALAVLASLAIFYFSAKYLDSLMWKVFAGYVAIGAVIWLVMLFEARRNPENYAVDARQGTVEGAE